MLLALTACTAQGPLVARSSPSPSAQVTPAGSLSPSPGPSPSAVPSSTPSAQPSPAASPAAYVGCLNRAAGANTVLLGRGGEFGEMAIYDVTDPVHPHLLCRALRTSANLSSSSNFEYLDPRSATETNITIRWFGTNAEGPAGKLPGWITSAVWLPTGAVGAYSVRLDSSATCPGGAVQVWTYTSGASELLTTYCIGIGDCICRFGLPGPVLAISPDGQYLVEGWLTGKGSQPMGVYRLADRVRVTTLPTDTHTAFWDRNSSILYVVTTSSVQVWAPGHPLLDEPNAAGWSFFPNLSPDGDYVAYTAYSDRVQMTQPRVYVYGTRTSTTKLLTDQPRSQVVFVKDGWVWYFEEVACADCPNGTKSSGKVFAMNLSTGVEQQVTFEMDATVINEMYPGQFWPNS